MTSGIYLLRFNNTHKVYIGQSLNIETRFNNHKYTLSKNAGAKKLQEAYNEYGVPIIEVLVEADKEELDTLESEAIGIFNSIDDGFNTYLDTKQNSALHGEEHPSSKFTNASIEEAFMLLVKCPEKTQKNIAELTGVSRTTIREISAGNNHTWLSTKYPDEYAIMLTRKGNRCTSAAKGIEYPLLLSPTGEVHTIENLRDFASTHSLDRRNLSRLFIGGCKSVKGWTLYKV